MRARVPHVFLVCAAWTVVACSDDAKVAAEIAQLREEVTAARADASAARTQAAEALRIAGAATGAAHDALSKARDAESDASAAKTAAGKRACTEAPAIPKPGAPRVEMSAEGMKINGTLLPKRPTLKNLEALVGKASRGDSPLLWDKVGIAAWVKDDGRVTQISLFLTDPGYSYGPGTMFAGRAELEGATLHVKQGVARSKTFAEGLSFHSHENDGGCLAIVGMEFLAK